MGLVSHAERELRLAGLFDENSDYNGKLGKATLDLIKIFAEQGHSGGSSAMVRELFSELSNFQNLTPITFNTDEWNDVSEMSQEPMWQSSRNPSFFSKDGGKTWYDVSILSTEIN